MCLVRKNGLAKQRLKAQYFDVCGAYANAEERSLEKRTSSREKRRSAGGRREKKDYCWFGQALVFLVFHGDCTAKLFPLVLSFE